jgi:hypothetical protein
VSIVGVGEGDKVADCGARVAVVLVFKAEHGRSVGREVGVAGPKEEASKFPWALHLEMADTRSWSRPPHRPTTASRARWDGDGKLAC